MKDLTSTPLKAAALAFAIACLFPAWTFFADVGTSRATVVKYLPGGFSFIGKPPEKTTKSDYMEMTWSVEIDVPRTVLMVLSVTTFAGLAASVAGRKG